MNHFDIARIQLDHRWQGYRMILAQNLGPGEVGVVSNIELKTQKRGVPPTDEVPLLMTYEAAQQLMDDLWSDGLRPTRQRDVAGEVEWLREQIGRIISKEWP